MRIADVLRNKGADVATVHPDATVGELLTGLADHNIGAMVVVGSAGVITALAGPAGPSHCQSAGRSRRLLTYPR